MPQTPYTDSEIKFSSWISLGVDALLTGTVSQNADGKYVIDYQLVDVVRGQLTNGQSKGLDENGNLVLSKDHILFHKKNQSH